MSEDAIQDWDEVLPHEPSGELVHWMAPKPLSIGPAGVSAAAAGAFVLGVASTLAVLALTHWLGPQREVEVPRRFRLRRRVRD
jgi:hypothetical protein